MMGFSGENSSQIRIILGYPYFRKPPNNGKFGMVVPIVFLKLSMIMKYDTIKLRHR